MLLSVKNRFLFVANTKTASTSVSNALRPHCEIERGGTPQRKHIAYREILWEYRFVFRQEGMEPETFFKFGIMRDPCDWIYSWFRYRKGNKVEAPLPADMTFAQFWERNDWNRSRRDGSPNLQRSSFEAWKGKIGLDVILPYHDLSDGFDAVTRHLGFDVHLPRTNVSRLKGSANEIDPALRQEVEAHFAADYELFESLARLNAEGFARSEARRAG